jgi:hypothetical protein
MQFHACASKRSMSNLDQMVCHVRPKNNCRAEGSATSISATICCTDNIENAINSVMNSNLPS